MLNINRSKNIKKIGVVLIALFLGVCSAVFGRTNGPYGLSWYTIDGGGGVSSGGQYIIRGTIGQHDAAYSVGSDYELLGGFWPAEPLCTVDFEDFARFAEYWLEKNPTANLYEDPNGIVNFYDLSEFVDEWLYYCPYDWPLR